ncbi:MAG: glycosyltransferase family 1 protein [Nitrospira sp.]
MHIGIDGVALQNPSYHAGLYQYTHRLIHSLSEVGQEHDFSLLFFNWRDRAMEDTIDRYPVGSNVRKQRCRVPFRVLGGLAALSLPVSSFVGRFDVFHGPTFRLPPGRYARRSVVTIHDLKFLSPESYSPGDRAGAEQFRKHTIDALERADVVVAVSQFTRADLAERLNYDSDHVRVIYPGINDEFRPDYSEEKIDHVVKQYGLRRPYTLFVGFHEEKKNLLRLVEAFAMVQSRITEPQQLVLAGPFGPVTPLLQKRIRELGLEAAVSLPGVIASEDLPALYAGASLFVFPSLHEGFGFPPLEAMASGVPVIASRAASLPEIVGSAALLVDPQQTESLADALLVMITDEARRQDLRVAGLQHVKQFSRRRMAEETLALYRELS